jgi:glycosyltransferase involved in cell wall biosynthesis
VRNFGAEVFAIKICFLMYHGSMESGGQGVYLANVTRELSRLGHDVHVISGPPYPILDTSVTEHRITTHSFQSMLLDRNAYFGRRAPLSHLQPLNFYEFATTRFTFSSLIAVFSLRALVKLREVEAQYGRFDIVHDNQTLSYGTYLTRSLMDRAVVANVHHPLDVDVANGLREVRSIGGRVKRIAWYPWHMQHVVARRLDALISGSLASAALIERLWRLPPGLMHTIYDGVDLDAFHPASASEMEPGTLLFVGNSEDYNKGVVYLLRAMAQLPAGTKIHLYVVGGPSGALRVAPMEIERLGIGDRVTIVGRVSERELAAWYRRAQLLVSPSLYEGFGLPVAEAMASGTAVIASDGGALPELVADSETGRVVPAGNATALADAIGGLMALPERCREMGAAGHRRVLERFTWGQTASNTEALYRDVLARRGAGRNHEGHEGARRTGG